MSSPISYEHLRYIEELGFKDNHFLSTMALQPIFMEYHPAGFIMKYIDMERTKTNAMKTWHVTDEPASNSGENNEQSGQYSHPSKKGDHNNNSGGVAWVESLSVELLDNGGGNMTDQPDEIAEAIPITPLLT